MKRKMLNWPLEEFEELEFDIHEEKAQIVKFKVGGKYVIKVNTPWGLFQWETTSVHGFGEAHFDEGLFANHVEDEKPKRKGPLPLISSGLITFITEGDAMVDETIKIMFLWPAELHGKNMEDFRDQIIGRNQDWALDTDSPMYSEEEGEVDPPLY